MRSISATLLGAQKASSNSPYTRVYLPNYGGGTDLSSYMKIVKHIEQPYGGSATILLGQAKTWFATSNVPIDLRGQQVDIGYGFTVGGTNYYSTTAPLWIGSTQLVSTMGVLDVELQCFDIWQKLQMLRICPSSVNIIDKAPGYEGDTTIFDIIDGLLTGITTLTKDSSDGIIDVYMPYIQFALNQPVATCILELMSMTNCYIRMRADGMHVGELSRATADKYEYNISVPGHVWWSDIYASDLVIPNRIIVVNTLPTDDGSYDYSGSADDFESYSKLGYYVTRPYEISGLPSNAECQIRAESILYSIQRSLSKGMTIAPHNCAQELFDYVNVIDSRWP